MPLSIVDAGTLRTFTRLTVRQAGVNRAIRTAKFMDSGSLRTVAVFADPLTVSVSPPGASGFAYGTGSITIFTNSVTATPSGGFAPFTYSWVRISGTLGSASFPSNATTSFSADTPSEGDYSATFRVTVTDALGATATADVPVTFSHLGNEGNNQ